MACASAEAYNYYSALYNGRSPNGARGGLGYYSNRGYWGNHGKRSAEEESLATPAAASDAWYGYYGPGSQRVDYRNSGYGVNYSDSQYGRYGLFVCLFVLLLS